MKFDTDALLSKSETPKHSFRQASNDFDHFEYNSKVELVFTGGLGHGDLGQATALAWWAGRAQRRVVLEAENPVDDSGKQPIELEPLFAEQKNKRRNWSDRFSMNRYN